MTSLIYRALTVFASACFLCFQTSVCNAQTVNLDATEDTTIYSENVDNNGGEHAFSIAGTANNGNERRSLLQFDLSGIAPGSLVNSASLDLDITQVGNTGGTFQLFRLDTDWAEGRGVGNQGAAALAGEATWNSAEFGSVDWTPGGSFFPQLLSEVSITSTGEASFSSSDNFIDAIQSIVDDPTQNFGFLISSSSGNGSAIRIGSREGGSAASLSVDFTAIPEPTGISILALSLAGLCLRRSKA